MPLFSCVLSSYSYGVISSVTVAFPGQTHCFTVAYICVLSEGNSKNITKHRTNSNRCCAGERFPYPVKGWCVHTNTDRQCSFFQDRAPTHKFNDRGTTRAAATIVEPLSSYLTLKFTECKNHPVALFYTQHFRSQQHIA